MGSVRASGVVTGPAADAGRAARIAYTQQSRAGGQLFRVQFHSFVPLGRGIGGRLAEPARPGPPSHSQVSQFIVLHTGGDAHAVGKIHFVATGAHDIGVVRLDGHLVVGPVGAGGHVTVDGGNSAGQGAVGILRRAGDGDLAGGRPR